MRKYLVRRLLTLIPTLLGVSLVVFALVRFIPGDPARVMMGAKARPESIRHFREQHGLDRPLYVQFVLWLGDMLQGNFGESLRTHTPVAGELMARFPDTVELTLAALSIGSAAGIGLGVLAATHRNKLFDYLCMVTALSGLSIPIFWLALLLVFFFSVQMGWFPTGGRLDYDLSVRSVTGFPVLDSLLMTNWEGFVSLIRHLALPTLTLAMPIIAVTANVTRSGLLEVLAHDYIRTARAKGVMERIVIRRHALRNALLPVVTVLGLNVGWLLGGAVVTESIFSWPGLGRYVLQSISTRDYPAIQASIFFIAMVFMLVNFVVDVLYAYIDPRVRYE